MLIDIFDRDEAHVGSGDGFADGGRIGGVVLAALAAHPVRRNELGGHQLHGVAELAEFSGPVVGAGTGFHADAREASPLGGSGRAAGGRPFPAIAHEPPWV